MLNIVEEYGDLFELDNSYALAHCVGNDFVMGAGIATIFRKRYGHQEWLINHSKGVGTTLLLNKDEIDISIPRHIFYMVTKKYSRTTKPT